MSLSHGHFYAAEKIKNALNESLKVKAIITGNSREYLLGAVGPDILYWAIFSPDPSSGGTFRCPDPHTDFSGQLIINLIERYLKNRADNKQDEPSILSFILGWITHWSTDLYIHTLIDQYGGPYSDEKYGMPRHTQLELVESKYICEMKLPLNGWSFTDTKDNTNSRRIWDFLTGPLTKTYKDAKMHPDALTESFTAALNHLSPIKVSSPRQKPNEKVPEQDTNLFWQFIQNGLRIVNSGWKCANEACGNNTGQVFDDQATVAYSTWSNLGAHIPSGKIYADILDPIRKISKIPAASGLDVQVNIGDTGLYGKFLVDYEKFSGGAVAKATEIINEVEKIINGCFLSDPPEYTPEDPKWQQLLIPKLKEKIDNGYREIDILEPEKHLINIDPGVMAIFDDKTRRNDFIREDTDKKELYYELKNTLQTEPVTGKSPKIDFDPYQKNDVTGIFGRRTGTGTFRIPINNPQPSDYLYELAISLTDKAAFTQSIYENKEFKYDEGAYFDLVGALMKCNCIEIRYSGPLDLTTKREDGTSASTRGNTTVYVGLARMHQPRTLAVDLRDNGQNGQRVDISWKGNAFTATLQANNPIRPITMPGSGEQPGDVGSVTRSVQVSGTIDPGKQRVSFEASEVYTYQDRTPDNESTQDMSKKFSASNLPFQTVEEDFTPPILFGARNQRALRECAAVYNYIAASAGKFMGSTGSSSEAMVVKDDDFEDCDFQIEFKQVDIPPAPPAPPEPPPKTTAPKDDPIEIGPGGIKIGICGGDG